MRIFFMAICVLLFAGCTAEDGKQKGNTQTSVVTDGSTATDTGRVEEMVVIPGKERLFKLLDSNLKADQLPGAIVYKGELKKGIRFEDEAGEQWLVFSEVGPYDPAEEKGGDYEGSNVALYASLYLKKGDSYLRKWQVYDFIEVCPVDLLAKFIPSSIQLTDLDHNGSAEIWMMYQTACHGDVSPQKMKLIMYEGMKKHAAKGENKIPAGEGVVFGGAFNIDPVLLKADVRKLDFAKQLWKKNEWFVFPNE